jgi:hypothetical protein
MKKIWKYHYTPFKCFSEKIIESVPVGSRPVHFEFDSQEGWIVWVEITDHPNTYKLHLQVVGTGWEYGEQWSQYFSVREGPHMWHLLSKWEV